MPTLRIFRLVWLIAAFGWLDGFAQERPPDKLLTVTTLKGLDSAALELKNSGRLAFVKVQFEEYTNVKSFAPDDSVLRRIDTLVFERSPKSLGTEVLNVQGTLLDIKGHVGTLILRGLAIQLGTSGSILLSGYDFNRVNTHLVLDSCFIFGDEVSSTFLSWYGSAGSTVKINRSFFVFKQGVASTATAPKMLFHAATFSFQNNLFNYPGILSATVLSDGKIDVHNNTFNRSQVNLLSTVFQRAIYDFNSNYIGYPPSVDALANSRGTSFLKATDFDTTKSLVRFTVQFTDWAGGFDHEANRTNWFRLSNESSNPLGNRRVSNGGKSQGELWNWYPPNADTSAGMGSGNSARRPHYNVFPVASDTLRGATLDGNAVYVHYLPALFPRLYAPRHVPIPIPEAYDSSLRILNPELGALSFGPFHIKTLKLSAQVRYGNPVLVAVDSGAGRLVSQAGVIDSTQYVFPNGRSSARAFYFGFRGNTPRGNFVSPALLANALRPGDSLVFSTVTAAGMTTVSDSAPPYPAAYRNLGSNYLIRTSAAIPGTANARLWTRGSAVIPWDSTKVYWWRGDSTEPVAAAREANGKFLVTMAAADSLRASLIERLNVPRGATTVFPLGRGASVVARSDSGYQLYIDSTALKYDTSLYGNPTPAYSLRFPGRRTMDSVTLFLPAGPDVGLFRTKQAGNDTLTPIAVPPKDTGYFAVNVGPGDSVVKIFSAIPYNVRARVRFDSAFPGLEVSRLHSATSGLFQPVTFDAALKERKTSDGDSLPAQANLLGGAAFRTLNLTPDTAGEDGFRLRFKFRAPEDSTQLQAFAWERATARWRKLGLVDGPDTLGPYVTNLRIGDSAVLVLEALRPPMDYLDSLKVDFRRDTSLSITTGYKIAGLSGPYRRFAIEYRMVDATGMRIERKAGPASIGETLTVPLSDFSGILDYQVRYYGVTDSISTSAVVERREVIWKRSLLRPDTAEKERYRWHLVGFPYGSRIKATLDSVAAVDSGVKNSRRYLLLDTESDGRTARWDTSTAKAPSYVFAAGDGLLFTAAVTMRYVVDSQANFHSAEPAVISPGKVGWRFVAVPFPMKFAVAKIQSRNGSTTRRAGPFFRLDVQPNPNPSDTGRKRVYSWHEVGASDRLEPFKGYAFFFEDGESLSFDPWDAVAAPLPKSSAAAPAFASVEVSLRSGGLSHAMRLVSGPGAREVPFLPSPVGGLEMRVGENGGSAWKRLDNLSAVDLPVRIDAPRAQRARLDFDHMGAPVSSAWRAALIDLATGEVIDPSAQDLSLPAGTSEYRLVAGSGDFVAERLSQFRAGLPTALILSQNTPNPFRGLTRIAVDWPALTSAAQSAGAGRRGYLEVFDARGKRMAKLDLGRAVVGRQWVTVDAARWEPGIYAYRLTVVTGAGLSRLQKRMLVIR